MGGFGSGNPNLNANRRPRRLNTSEVPRIGIPHLWKQLPAASEREVVTFTMPLTLRNGQEIRQQFRVVSVPTNFGDGRRRWILCCPVCERHVAHLYIRLDKLSDHLACRHCQTLAYRSSQQAHFEERLYRSIAKLREYASRVTPEGIITYRETKPRR